MGFQIYVNFFEFMFLACDLRVWVPLWKSGTKTQENNKFHNKIVDCVTIDLLYISHLHLTSVFFYRA